MRKVGERRRGGERVGGKRRGEWGGGGGREREGGKYIKTGYHIISYGRFICSCYY